MSWSNLEARDLELDFGEIIRVFGKIIVSQDYCRKDIFSSTACGNVILSKSNNKRIVV